MEVFLVHHANNMLINHCFGSVYNSHEQIAVLTSIETLINEAKKLYSEAGCTNGLILGYDGKNPPADKVIIYGEGKYDSEYGVTGRMRNRIIDRRYSLSPNKRKRLRYINRARRRVEKLQKLPLFFQILPNHRKLFQKNVIIFPKYALQPF